MGGVFLLVILIVFIGKSFAVSTPISSITIDSETIKYNEPGGYRVTKSAKWISKGKARITIDVDSTMFTNDKAADIIMVLDVSGSMAGEKLNRVKEDTIYLINKLIPAGNRIALVTFDTSSTIITDFTTDTELLNNTINNLNTGGTTNYYQALVNVDNILKNYNHSADRGCIALFLTDGYPCEDTPNQIPQYEYLKKTYPWLTINGIQYEMGDTVLQQVIEVSDNQYIASLENLNTFLLKATVSPLTYLNFELTDYINSEYFTIDDVTSIESTAGKTSLDNNKVVWNLDGVNSGDKYTLTIDVKLKDELIGVGGIYPTNEKLDIKSEINNKKEDISSTKTPVLADNYQIIYEANTPSGCSVTNMPSNTKASVFDTVSLSDTVPKCDGYKFNGWEISTPKDIKKVNDDYFIMPEENLVVKATWAKLSIAKATEGTIFVKQTLYKMLESEATSGSGLAKKYTGAHQDSIDNSGTKDIYYYYASDSTNAAKLLNMNNVIFANHCWQMVRTTDTGGVKLIYNGEVEDGKCLNTRGTHVGYSGASTQTLSSNYYYGTDYTYDKESKTFSLAGDKTLATWNDSTYPNLIGKYTCKSSTETGTCTTLYYVEDYNNSSGAKVLSLTSSSHYSQFGKSPFNRNYNSPSYVGYMYNTVYPYNSKSMTSSDTMASSSSLGTTYWYADEVNWDGSRWSLVNPYQVTNDEYVNLVGKYTFRSSSQTYTSSSVQYITGVNGTTYYYLNLYSGNNIDYYNDKYTFGDSYTDNGDGAYTITSPTTIGKVDWYSNYSGKNGKYVCKNAIDNTCSNVWYTTSTSTTSITYIPSTNNYKYAKDYTYENGTYKLRDDSAVTFWNINDSTNKTSLNNAHYTCFNTTGECEKLSYIYYVSGTTSYYIELANNKSAEDALVEMLSADNVNLKNSTMKSAVEAWYGKYMTDYTKYLEDTIFCNNRSINQLGGWNPNGGSTSGSYLYFKEKGTKDLSCSNVTDQFSTKNSKAKLKYPVGLMTISELLLLGSNDARKTGQWYWSASPRDFYGSYAYGLGVSSFGDSSVVYVNGAGGVRPSVSLAPGAWAAEGDGSMENPYIVEFDY